MFYIFTNKISLLEDGEFEDMENLENLKTILKQKANIVDKKTDRILNKSILSETDKREFSELIGKYAAYHEVLLILEQIKE